MVSNENPGDDILAPGLSGVSREKGQSTRAGSKEKDGCFRRLMIFDFESTICKFHANFLFACFNVIGIEQLGSDRYPVIYI